MDFGRLPDILAVDFTLPPDAPENTALLHTLGTSGSTAFYTGCPVWGEKNWQGLIYPEQVKPAMLLTHYAQQFNAIELNSTYYNIPAPKTVEGWKNSVGKGFRFCPKIPKIISHEKMLVGCDDLVHVFCNTMEALGEHLGAYFLQLPPGFGPEQQAALLQFAEKFPGNIPLHIEFRNERWFTKRDVLQETFTAMQDMGTGTVITDTAGRRDVLHMRLTTATAFIRFTANNLHPTDHPRITAWSKRIAQWKTDGIEKVYFFVHSPDHAQMPHIVNLAVQELNAACDAGLQPCRFLERQGELF